MGWFLAPAGSLLKSGTYHQKTVRHPKIPDSGEVRFVKDSGLTETVGESGENFFSIDLKK